jgi:hypothetical protein
MIGDNVVKYPQEWTDEAWLAVLKVVIRELNKDAFGSHYRRLIKQHSYFSYVFFVEKQARGATHLHGLTTGPIHLSLVHQLVSGYGFAWIDTVYDRLGAAEYVSKYVGKGGHFLTGYKAEEMDKHPQPLPRWWRVPALRQLNLPV